VNPHDIFKDLNTVLLIDWPSGEVPEELARAGFHVIVRGGPGPQDYSAYELADGKVVARRTGRPPERADLIYAYRPLSELPEIIATAKALRARIIWTQSGLAAGKKDPKGCWLRPEELRHARTLVESAGLVHIAAPYILDALAASETLKTGKP
jgi:hypothetical protein